ncbi:Protein kinase domain-containing protein [Trichostrongylus colubriformis]|uniref:Protein kinase domain-containing protein n=1 Tax=Trichostrongylus colubriformis TaxID=6319 RepID=A0AAN8FF09_TRICO
MLHYFNAFLLICFLCYSSRTENCPTMGMSGFILVTVSSSLDYEGFVGLVTYYSRLMPLSERINYKFNFGRNISITIETDSLENEVGSWIEDDEQMRKFWSGARTASSSFEQYDDPGAPLSSVIKSFYDIMANDNQHPSTVMLKKQVVLLADYIPLNVTEAMNAMNIENEQKLGLFHELNLTEVRHVVNFPAYSTGNEIIPTRVRKVFQKSMEFEFPKTVYQGKPIDREKLFMMGFDGGTVQRVLKSAVMSDLCGLPANKMLSDFLVLKFAHNGSVHDLTIPFLGDQTKSFALHCIEYFNEELGVDSGDGCDGAAIEILDNFVADFRSNQTFVSLLITDTDCAAQRLANSTEALTAHGKVRLISSQDLSEVFEKMTLPSIELGYLNSTVDTQIVLNTAYYLGNFSTSCRSEMPLVPLLQARPYHRPKYFYIAMEDMLWITLCATISVSVFGIVIYQHVKRQHKKQMEILTEMMLQPRVFKTAKECPKVARLPWEIKSDHVHIDTEFLLGEGTISNVYLGKLKGKAPILQWIGRVEMKQYQDCPVAVRVPRHFDEPEEDQLFREISSMRRLRHHDHIALFLGWTNKNDLVCSLLELTHMNLLKYLGQIQETVSNGDARSTAYIPYQMLFKIIWEICDGISYIHSRNLIHRDLAARNVLLTTGLRAKISGFGFCSDPDDPKFSGNSLAVRYLPVRWLAPECFQGKFSQKSDTWSFGVLLYEIFTLGDVPYEDLQKSEEIVECVLHSRIPAHPKYASRQTYNIMQRCFHRYPERRPFFIQLKDIFQAEMESLFANPAFASDDEQ